MKLHIAAELSKVCMSPPARGRGLKLMKGGDENEVGQVAPRAGAWIETYLSAPAKTGGLVAPRAGAWIET